MCTTNVYLHIHPRQPTAQDVVAQTALGIYTSADTDLVCSDKPRRRRAFFLGMIWANGAEIIAVFLCVWFCFFSSSSTWLQTRSVSYATVRPNKPVSLLISGKCLQSSGEGTIHFFTTFKPLSGSDSHLGCSLVQSEMRLLWENNFVYHVSSSTYCTCSVQSASELLAHS